eukprot:2550603-Pleurochrysis_carterae.AAC.1
MESNGSRTAGDEARAQQATANATFTYSSLRAMDAHTARGNAAHALLNDEQATSLARLRKRGKPGLKTRETTQGARESHARSTGEGSNLPMPSHAPKCPSKPPF